jgi:hypothetical protein
MRAILKAVAFAALSTVAGGFTILTLELGAARARARLGALVLFGFLTIYCVVACALSIRDAVRSAGFGEGGR